MTTKVRFQVNAGLYNDLLNYLRQKEIILFDIVFDTFGFCATCYAADYKYIARRAKKYQTKTKIIKKIGLYFVLKPYTKRKGILTAHGKYYQQNGIIRSFCKGINRCCCTLC